MPSIDSGKNRRTKHSNRFPSKTRKAQVNTAFRAFWLADSMTISNFYSPSSNQKGIKWFHEIFLVRPFFRLSLLKIYLLEIFHDSPLCAIQTLSVGFYFNSSQARLQHKYLSCLTIKHSKSHTGWYCKIYWWRLKLFKSVLESYKKCFSIYTLIPLMKWLYVIINLFDFLCKEID